MRAAGKKSERDAFDDDGVGGGRRRSDEVRNGGFGGGDDGTEGKEEAAGTTATAAAGEIGAKADDGGDLSALTREAKANDPPSLATEPSPSSEAAKASARAAAPPRPPQAVPAKATGTGGRGTGGNAVGAAAAEGEASGGALSSSSAASSPPGPSAAEEEEDEEIRRATAMALAMAANPNLTPEELSKMLDPDNEQKKLVEEKMKTGGDHHHHAGGGVGGKGLAGLASKLGVAASTTGLHLSDILAKHDLGVGQHQHQHKQREQQQQQQQQQQHVGEIKVRRDSLGGGGGGASDVPEGATSGAEQRRRSGSSGFLTAFSESFTSEAVEVDGGGGGHGDDGEPISHGSENSLRSVDEPTAPSSRPAAPTKSKSTKKQVKSGMKTLHQTFKAHRDKAKKQWADVHKSQFPVAAAAAAAATDATAGLERLATTAASPMLENDHSGADKGGPAAAAASERAEDGARAGDGKDAAGNAAMAVGDPTGASVSLAQGDGWAASGGSAADASSTEGESPKATPSAVGQRELPHPRPPKKSVSADDIPPPSAATATDERTKKDGKVARSSSAPAASAKPRPQSASSLRSHAASASASKDSAASTTTAPSAAAAPAVAAASAEPSEDKKKIVRGADNPPIRLSGIVWKRRSGLGKLSAKHAWERRRITLQGTKVMYYKTREEAVMSPESTPASSERGATAEVGGSGASDANSGGGGTAAAPPAATDGPHVDSLVDPAAAAAPPPSSHAKPHSVAATAAAKRAAWWEQAAINIQTARENLSQLAAAAVENSSSSDPNEPRGVLDIVKERVSISAATGHSGAPTPFAISIKAGAKKETKWKFCFDSHANMMEWLAAMTDVVVRHSVDEYNRSLSAAEANAAAGGEGVLAMMGGGADQGGGGGAFFQAAEQILKPAFAVNPPPARDAFGDGPASARSSGISSTDDDDDRRASNEWKVESYTISSRGGLFAANSDESDAKEGEVDAERKANEEEDGAAAEERDASRALPDIEGAREEPKTIVIEDVSPPTKTWSLRGKELYKVLALVNGAMFHCRASSTSVEHFWLALVLVNLGIWLCAERDAPEFFRSENRSATTGGAESAGTAGQKVRFASDAAASGDAASAGASEAASSATDRNKKHERKLTPVEESKRALSLHIESGDKDHYVPAAGCSSRRIQNADDPKVDEKGRYFAGWRRVPGSDLKVRSHGYLKTKQKVPSPGELYECVACDAFETGSRVSDLAGKVKLPEVKFDGDVGGSKKTWHSPDVFVVSLSVPTEQPKLGRPTDDGLGWTITMYFAMTKKTREILKRVTAPGYNPSQDEPTPPDIQKSTVNAVRLFEEWCRRAPSDPKFQARFKFVPNGCNLAEIGMPSWITKYNGKPVLIKRAGITGFLFSHPDKSAMEFDISLHPFPYLAKQAMAYMKTNFFSRSVVTFGFTIEGRADDELPECLIGSMQLCYADPEKGISGEEFFAGTSPRSFGEDN